jgi:hypothetical protein
VHSLYRSSTRGPEDDSVESKHVAPLSHYMFNITTVVFDGISPTVISQTFRDGTPQVQKLNFVHLLRHKILQRFVFTQIPTKQS